MAIKIRLARGGSKKRPFYSIVVADVRSPRDGRFIEKLGIYNPLLAKDNPGRVQYKEDRIKHWLSVGALPTDRVARFLNAGGLYTWKAGNNPNKGKPGARALELIEEKAKKAESAKEVAEAAKNAPAPAEEAPADEAAAE